MYESYVSCYQVLGEYDVCELGVGFIVLQQYVGRDFEDGIVDEEQFCVQVKGCCVDVEIGCEMIVYEIDVDVVDVVDDEYGYEQWQDVLFDFVYC